MDTMHTILASTVMTLAMSGDALAQRATPAPQGATPAPSERGLLPEPQPVSKAIELFDERTVERTAPKDGFYVDMGDMITGSGFIAAGPGYRHHVFNKRALFWTSAAISTRLYMTAQTGVEFPSLGSDRVRAGVMNFYQDARQVNFFGVGNDSGFESRTGYRLRTNDVVGYAAVGTPRLLVSSRVGWLSPVRVSTMSGRRPSYPDTVLTFTEETAPGLGTHASFMHGDVSLSSDRRDSTGHPTRGGLYQATWSAYSDRSGTNHSFQRLELEAAQFVPVRSPNWVIALHGFVATTQPFDGHDVPIYLMPSLGGRNDRGYADYRFHDRNLQAYTIESRLALFEHVDTALFVDFGNVAPTISQLRVGDIKRSYGAGIRLHNHRRTIGRVDIAHSTEGWRLMFKMNDPFRRSSQTVNRPAVVPFVP